ncbi:MAG: hypothetical protein AAF513_06495 [Pseudomonadota bacterium]
MEPADSDYKERRQNSGHAPGLLSKPGMKNLLVAIFTAGFSLPMLGGLGIIEFADGPYYFLVVCGCALLAGLFRERMPSA